MTNHDSLTIAPENISDPAYEAALRAALPGSECLMLRLYEARLDGLRDLFYTHDLEFDADFYAQVLAKRNQMAERLGLSAISESFVEQTTGQQR